MMLVERLLQPVHRSDAPEAFNGFDAAAVGLHREHQAGAHAVAVEKHGAGAADAVFAADMGAGEAKRMAQEIGEQQPRLHRGRESLAVDGHGDVARLAHAALSLARRQAAASARPVSTPAR